jgi:hypothetical protein
MDIENTLTEEGPHGSSQNQDKEHFTFSRGTWISFDCADDRVFR